MRNVSPLSRVASGMLRKLLPHWLVAVSCSTMWSHAPKSGGMFAHWWPPKTAIGLVELMIESGQVRVIEVGSSEQICLALVQSDVYGRRPDDRTFPPSA